MKSKSFIHDNKIRIFFIGDWFSVSAELKKQFMELMEDTKDYDNFFINFCFNYDGQEEVLGVIKLLAAKAKMGKLDLQALNKQDVKENLYTSYFAPPEIIIEPYKTYSGLLLWDSKGAKIYQTRKSFLEFKESDISEAIKWAQRENTS